MAKILQLFLRTEQCSISKTLNLGRLDLKQKMKMQEEMKICL